MTPFCNQKGLFNRNQRAYLTCDCFVVLFTPGLHSSSLPFSLSELSGGPKEPLAFLGTSGEALVFIPFNDIFDRLIFKKEIGLVPTLV